MATVGGQGQNEVLAEGEWNIGAEVSLPDFEIFRLFKLPFLSEMDICPAHTSPIAPGRRILRSFGKGEACGPLKFQSLWVCKKASGFCVLTGKAPFTEGPRGWVGHIPRSL